MAKANSKARGILMATIKAVRTLLEEHQQHGRYQDDAADRFSRTVSVVTSISSVRS